MNNVTLKSKYIPNSEHQFQRMKIRDGVAINSGVDDTTEEGVFMQTSVTRDGLLKGMILKQNGNN